MQTDNQKNGQAKATPEEIRAFLEKKLTQEEITEVQKRLDSQGGVTTEAE